MYNKSFRKFLKVLESFTLFLNFMSKNKYPWQQFQSERREERRPKPKPRTPIKKKFYVIKKVADNTAEELKIYRILSKDFKKDNPICQCGINHCQRETTDVHHKKGRGKYLNVVKYFLAVNRVCHRWINENNEEAMKLGLSLSRLTK